MADQPLLVIGNYNYSSWSLRAWLALRHAGVAFDVERIALDTPGADAAILAHNGGGTVPVLKIDGETIWESLSICEYAAEVNPALWPDAPLTRAVARSMACEVHAGFTSMRSAMPMNCRATGRVVTVDADIAVDIARIESIWHDCRDRFGAGGPWLFGRFSVADAMFAPVVSRFATYGITLASPLAARYAADLLADPAILEWFGNARAEHEIVVADEAGAVT